MTEISDSTDPPEEPEPSTGRQIARGALQVLGGAVPLVGGILAAAASAWSEHDQEQVNKVFRQWLQMLEDELREKAQTICEIISRLDMQDESIKARIESPEYQDLLKKAFRGWSNIDSESKRQKIRNILANAATAKLTTDDVVRLFLDWLNTYSDFHFEVIGEIYREQSVSRGDIWRNLNRPQVREDSPEADLYKLLIRDLSTGSVIRQRRQTDGFGRYVKKQRPATQKPFQRSNDPYLKSAFDDDEEYVLTELGKQFVHYAMNELVPRIEFHPSPSQN